MPTIEEVYNKYSKEIIESINNDFDFDTITIPGEICKLNKYYNKIYFTLKDDNTILYCVANHKLYDKLNNNLNKKALLEGVLKLTHNKVFKNFQLQFNVSDVIQVDIDNDNELLNIIVNNDYCKNKKEINWMNVKNILLLSKEDTHGYNDFITHSFEKMQTENIINIDLYEIILEGNGVENSLIKAINYGNEKNYDLIIICRGGGLTENISASFDKLTIFNVMKNSNIPIATAIGHSDDKNENLLITQVSDYDFTTPTEAGICILNVYYRQIEYMKQEAKKIIEYYVEQIIKTVDEYIDEFDVKINEIESLCNVNNIIEINDINCVIKFGEKYFKINTLDEIDDDNINVKEIINNYHLTGIINVDKMIEYSIGDVKIKCCQLKEFMINKNISECITIKDEIINDCKSFMIDNNLVNKEIIKAFNVLELK